MKIFSWLGTILSALPLQTKMLGIVLVIAASAAAIGVFARHNYDLGYAAAKTEQLAANALARVERDIAVGKASTIENSKNIEVEAVKAEMRASSQALQAKLQASVAKQPRVKECAGDPEDLNTLNEIISKANGAKK